MTNRNTEDKYKIISQNDKMTFPSPRKRVLVKSGRIRNE